MRPPAGPALRRTRGQPDHEAPLAGLGRTCADYRKIRTEPPNALETTGHPKGLRVFLTGDGVTVAMAGQETPDGYYRLDRTLSVVPRHGGQIGCCGTCMDARGVTQAMLLEGAARSTIDELTDWTLAADKVLVF